MIFTFIPNLLNDVWVDSHNRLIGVFYVSNDLAGLLAVPDLPYSTQTTIIQPYFYSQSFAITNN